MNSDDEIFEDQNFEIVSSEDEDSNNSSRPAQQDKNYSFDVLSVEEIVQQIEDLIRDVSELIDIPTGTARILLSCFKWNKDKLMDRFYDGDWDKLFQKVQVTVSNNRQKIGAIGTSCGICHDQLEPRMRTELECGDVFCLTCLTTYMTTKILDGDFDQTVSCAASDCDALVDVEIVMQLVQDSDAKRMCRQLIANNYVKVNRLLRWCPSDNCSYAVKVQYVDQRAVTCKCNREFCFGCGENWHYPIQCDLMAKWCAEMETSIWMEANTKLCPNCSVRIQKDDGCRQVTCSMCKYRFCWLCLKSTEFSCRGSCVFNTMHPRQNIKFTGSLHWYDHYRVHTEMPNFRNDLFASFELRIESKNISWMEIPLLRKVLDVYWQSHQTHFYGNLLTYFLGENNHSTMFKHTLKQLEMAKERLLTYVRPADESENEAYTEGNVHHDYQHCENLRKALVDHVREGYERNSWELDPSFSAMTSCDMDQPIDQYLLDKEPLSFARVINDEDNSYRRYPVQADEHHSFEVFAPEEIYQQMMHCINAVRTLINIEASSTTKRVLLDHFKWNETKFRGQIREDDQAILFKSAGITVPRAVTTQEIQQTESEDCKICSIQTPASRMVPLQCGHRFCEQCLRKYLTTRIAEKTFIRAIPCVADGCGVYVEDQIVMQLLQDDDVKLAYQLLITNNFVENNHLMRWCPVADCNYAIKMKYFEQCPVTCRCSSRVFCFECGANWHYPVSCRLMERWNIETDDTDLWKPQDSKECPKCDAKIMKNFNGSRMKCQNCHYRFCWTCMRSVNSLLPSKSCVCFGTGVNRADRFRFRTPTDSQLYDSCIVDTNRNILPLSRQHLYTLFKAEVEEIQRRIMSQNDVQFLELAIELLRQCYQTLMYSYVFLYYLQEEELLKFGQYVLELAVVHLLEYLKQHVTTTELTPAVRQKVEEKYRNCKTKLESFLKLVHEKYSNRSLKFLELTRSEAVRSNMEWNLSHNHSLVNILNWKHKLTEFRT